jgi:hypothetical protein
MERQPATWRQPLRTPDAGFTEGFEEERDPNPDSALD